MMTKSKMDDLGWLYKGTDGDKNEAAVIVSMGIRIPRKGQIQKLLFSSSGMKTKIYFHRSILIVM